MSEERAVPLSSWPKQATYAEPITVADDVRLSVRYRTIDEKIAVIHFPLCNIFTFGAPNDEALFGHPLYGHGLEFYSVHQVENSSRIALLERRNSVHHGHDRKRFLEDKKHYIFTFKDSTLECVVNEGKFWPTEIVEFSTEAEAEADSYIQKKMKP